jgi:hypothetical protein
VLEGLDAVNWAALGHAYGSAEDVPWLLRQVRSADSKAREDAVDELCFTIVHQGTRYSATAPAVPFLVELATAPDTHNRARVVNLLAYAAVGDDQASLPDGIVTLDQLRQTTNTPGNEHEYGPWALAAYQAVHAAVPALLPLLDEADDRLRRETAHLLAWFPSFAPVSLPRLRARLGLEAERDTRATMIVAVGLLAGATGLRSDTPLAVGAAGRTRSDPAVGGGDRAGAPGARAPAGARRAGVARLGHRSARHQRLYTRRQRQRLSTPGRASLRRLHAPDPGPAGSGGAPARRRGAVGQAGWCLGLAGRGLLWHLMVVAFEGDPQAPRPPFAGLKPLQQRIVAALTRMPWIWQAAPGERVPADNPLWAYGLPSTQQGLRTYATDVPPR